MKSKLVVALRICPALSSTAAVFADKFEMVEATAKSLAVALKPFSVKLYVVLDGCPPRYRDLCEHEFGSLEGVQLQLIETPSIGNLATFAKQIELLSTDCEADLVYVCEDDYLYRPHALSAMAELLKLENVDFVTPLDHPDRYNCKLGPMFRSEVIVCADWHWVRAATTCCTFMTTSKKLKEAKDRLLTYSSGSGDVVMWLLLTKNYLFDICWLAKVFLHTVFCRETRIEVQFPLLTWLQHPILALFRRKCHLWSPVPTLGIHLCSVSLSVGIKDFPGCTNNMHWDRSAEMYLSPYNRYGIRKEDFA